MAENATRPREVNYVVRDRSLAEVVRESGEPGAPEAGLTNLQMLISEVVERHRGEAPPEAFRAPPAVGAFVEEMIRLTEAPEVLDDPEVGRRAARAIAGAAVQEMGAGPLLSTDEVRQMLRAETRNAPHALEQRGGLLAVRGPGRRVRYPLAQFDPSSERPWPVMKRVLEYLRRAEMTDWSIAGWLASGRLPELEGASPRHWLLTGGDPEMVVTAAAQTARALEF